MYTVWTVGLDTKLPASRQELTRHVVKTIEEAKQLAVWGTYGLDALPHCQGRCPVHQLVWRRLIDCNTEHLQAILRTQPQVYGSCDYAAIIYSILEDRGIKPLWHGEHHQRRSHLGPA
jgi:hypothetical protein